MSRTKILNFLEGVEMKKNICREEELVDVATSLFLSIVTISETLESYLYMEQRRRKRIVAAHVPILRKNRIAKFSLPDSRLFPLVAINGKLL